MKLRYAIKTLTGRRIEVEAESPEDALERAGVSQAECRRWYPLPLRAVPTSMSQEVKERLRGRAMERAKQCNVCGGATWSRRNVCRECRRIGERS